MQLFSLIGYFPKYFALKTFTLNFMNLQRKVLPVFSTVLELNLFHFICFNIFLFSFL